MLKLGNIYLWTKYWKVFRRVCNANRQNMLAFLTYSDIFVHGMLPFLLKCNCTPKEYVFRKNIFCPTQEHSDTRSSAHSSPQMSPPEGTWKWSGTDFVKSPTEEPWELTRLNNEAALVCVVSPYE